MDKEYFIRLEKSIREMKNALLGNSDENGIATNSECAELRKLLYYSKEDIKGDLSSLKDVTRAAVEDNVILTLVTRVETTPPFNKRNYITITCSNGQIGDNNNGYAIKVIVMSEKNDWVINNSMIRPLRIMQIISNLLDNKQFACSGELLFERFSELITNDDVTGYAMFFSFSDGTGDQHAQHIRDHTVEQQSN
jgi:hypothetical protein